MAVAVFGINSGAAFAAVIGLVNVAFYSQRRYFRTGRPEVVDVTSASGGE